MSSASVPIVPDVDERQLNRELSWLDFNARVLALADDDRGAAARTGEVLRHLLVQPRRVLPGAGGGAEGPGGGGHRAAHARRAHAGPAADRDQRPGGGARAGAGGAATSTGWCRRCAPPAWSCIGWDDLDEDDRKYLVEVFEHRIFPVLTPLAVDPGHPFPYISNLSLNLAVLVRDPESDERVASPG